MMTRRSALMASTAAAAMGSATPVERHRGTTAAWACRESASQGRAGQPTLRARPPAGEPPRAPHHGVGASMKKIIVDEAGTEFQAMTFGGFMPGPLLVVALSRCWVSLWSTRRRTSITDNIDFHARPARSAVPALTLVRSWRAGRAYAGKLTSGRLCLSLRAGWSDNSLACRGRHARCDHGPSAGRARTELATRSTMTGFICSARTTSTCRGMRKGNYANLQSLGMPTPTRSNHAQAHAPHVVFNGRPGVDR